MLYKTNIIIYIWKISSGHFCIIYLINHHESEWVGLTLGPVSTDNGATIMVVPLEVNLQNDLSITSIIHYNLDVYV